MPKNSAAEKKTIINVDVVIDRYNEANPTLKKLTKRALAEKLGVGAQLLTDWKAGKTPNVVPKLQILMDLGNCELRDFVTTED